MPVPTTQDLITLGTLTFLVTVFTEIIMRAWQPRPELKDRFGPIIAIAMGVVLAVLGSLNLNADLASGAMVGVYAGLASMGFYKGVKVLYEVGSPPGS